jgi:electron transport complex protein RnfE
MKNNLSIVFEGLWHNNPGFVQLLGLCPLLAVSNTAINALGLGIATLLTLVASNVTVSLFRQHIPNAVRIPIFVLIIASLVTAIELLIKAYYYPLYMVLGIFIPLIVTNCTIIGRAEAFAIKNNVMQSFLDGLANGLGSVLALFSLGAVREILGQGSLFADASIMFGESASWMSIQVIENYHGFLLALLPSGAFLGLGLLIAMKNSLDRLSIKKY